MLIVERTLVLMLNRILRQLFVSYSMRFVFSSVFVIFNKLDKKQFYRTKKRSNKLNKVT